MITHIGQVAIAITDLARSVDFYERILGLKKQFEVPPNMAFFECGRTRLMLTTLQGSESDHHTSTIYYSVPNIDAAFEHLCEQGVEIERAPQLAANMPDHELWLGFVRDPDHNLIGLMEERR